jgi:TamB, inner membrane protein subunit of TAM complex
LNKKNKIRIKNLLIQVAALLVINVIIILSFFQLSSVQTYLGRLVANDISAKTGFHVSIDKVDIVWMDRLILEGVKINDFTTNEMISVARLKVNYSLSSLRNNQSIRLDKVVLDHPKVNLYLGDNISLNIAAFIYKMKNAYAPKKGKKPKPFIIMDIELRNGSFTYNHLGKNSLDNRFDYNHFGFDSINAVASDLAVVADTFKITIDNLKSIETSTQLPIKALSVQYQMSKARMKFNDLNLNIGNSVIKDSIVFDYEHITDLNNFIEDVLISSHFEHLKIASQDLKFFAPYFDTIKDTIYFTGNVNGHINDFITNDFNIRFGKNSNLKGSAYFEGLPDVLNTFINLKFSKSKIYKNDLEIYIPSESFGKYYPIDSAKVNGSFTGYPKDFVANASFSTDIGFINTDLNLKLDEDARKSKYSGFIKLVDFDLGKLGDSSSYIGKATLSGKIKGLGLTILSANFTLESTIDKIELNRYNYRNIKTNAHFAQGLFDGSVIINDPNLKFKTTGIIDLRNKKNTIDLRGELTKAKLDKLNIRKDSSDIAAKFDINIKGISLDSIVGNLEISELKAHNKEQDYYVNNFKLVSSINNKKRVLSLLSDRVDLKMEGKFNFTTAFKDLKNIYLEHKLKFLNQKNAINKFYQDIDKATNKSNIDFDLKLYDANPLLNLFVPSLYLSRNSRIIGNFKNDSITSLSVKFNNDTIIYDDNFLLENNFELKSVSNYFNQNLLMEVAFNSEQQILQSKSRLDSLVINALWKNELLDFNLHIQDAKGKNINNLNGQLLFKNDTTLLSILDSKIEVLDKVWFFDKDNKITFTKDQVLLSKMNLVSGDQALFASGSISKLNNHPITIEASNIEMNNFNPLINNELKGVLNGSAKISDIFSTPLIESKIIIDSFSVDGYRFGNIEGRSNWNQANELFDINFFIERDNFKLVNVVGTYAPLGDEKALNLDAKLIDTDLNLVQPFTKGLFSNLGGYLSGNILITGSLFKPKLNGKGEINNASITVDYLQSTLNVEGNWAMDSTSISMSNVKITDNSIGTGNLEATFTHSNYKNFNMELIASYSNLITLNTAPKDNTYFYGTAVGSGNLSIIGPISNLTITARAKTEKGTKFYIPLSDTKGGVKQEEFIDFTSFTKEIDEVITPIKKEVKLKNISVNLDIEITPEAYAEIIFDLTAGDIIRGRGNGNLSLAIDTKGEFTVFGDYEFTEGAYNFTMYNVVNKELKIEPKSKISWSGDPYLGKMDIDAIYEVNTSLAPIMDTIYRDLSEVKRIFPSKVLLDLDGPLLSPDIKFDIIIEDYPRSNVNIDTEVRAFLNKIHNDEQEMNRQVFSLLVFRKYSPPNAFSTGGTLGSSMSEFISNQLSYWISQVDDNLTIDFDFDLSELDENALQTFQLRVSYAFMEGKLIVTRDGGFTDQNQDATLSSIAGDWTVEYLLSQDGKLRVKIFKKTNYDQLSSSTSTNNELITGGFSLLYTTSFDNLKELFKQKKEKQNKKNKENLNSREAVKPEDELNIP